MLWVSARLALALRRTQRFRRWWLSIGGVGTVIALLVPVARPSQSETLQATLTAAVADSARTATALARAQARAASADSLAAADTGVLVAAPALRAETPLSSLEAAIAAARNGRARADVLALAAHPLLASGPRMRATADSLRQARDAVSAGRLSGTIIAMAEFRWRAMGGTTAAAARAPSPTTPDTAAVNAIVRAQRDSLDQAQRRHEAARAAVASAAQAVAAERASVPPVSPGLAMLALVLVGFVVRVGLAMVREFQGPTVAHSMEAERSVGAPALSHVRDGLPEGPLRFRPSGVDPFRVLYLHLTSTGTRARSVIVTGDDALVVTAVAARLAIAAAADHRTTLVAEWDTEQVALARIFRDHAEPGVSDAMSGAFSWRDVARNVGSSDGLSIAMLPAGTTRESLGADARAAALEGFARFRSGFEFSIVAATLRDLADARALLPDAPTVLCASIGVTPVAELERAAAVVEAGADPVHSLVLWDAPRPELLSRAELAAWLSKRKGRTPGGSFKAVQEAIKEPPKEQ